MFVLTKMVASVALTGMLSMNAACAGNPNVSDMGGSVVGNTGIPEIDMDFVEIGWGGSMADPDVMSVRRVYADDAVYYFEGGWGNDTLLSDTVAGAYARAVVIVNQGIAPLGDGTHARECNVLDYGADRIVIRSAGETRRFENYCPGNPEGPSNLGPYGNAFFAMYYPLKELMGIERE